MPEYLYPGVYVEEYDGRTQSIPGVSTSTDELIMRSLAPELRDIVRRIEPDWTDRDSSDPGVTVLEVLAWLADMVLYRSAPVAEQGRQAAIRAVATLFAFARPCSPANGTVTRPHFFAGQLLDPGTLQAEQDYHRGKQRRHNRSLHGAGIVEGLEIRVEATADAPDGRVRIDPGYAIDSCGEEITLERGAVVALPRAGDQMFVSLRYQDVPSAPVLSPTGEPTFSRIEEVCVVALVDAVTEPAIALARLLRSAGQWSVDRCFVPRRVLRGSHDGSGQ